MSSLTGKDGRAGDDWMNRMEGTDVGSQKSNVGGLKVGDA